MQKEIKDLTKQVKKVTKNDVNTNISYNKYDNSIESLYAEVSKLEMKIKQAYLPKTIPKFKKFSSEVQKWILTNVLEFEDLESSGRQIHEEGMKKIKVFHELKYTFQMENRKKYELTLNDLDDKKFKKYVQKDLYELILDPRERPIESPEMKKIFERVDMKYHQLQKVKKSKFEYAYAPMKKLKKKYLYKESKGKKFLKLAQKFAFYPQHIFSTILFLNNHK